MKTLQRRQGDFSYQLLMTFVSSILSTLTIVSILFVTNNFVVYNIAIFFVPGIFLVFIGGICRNWKIMMYVPLVSVVSILLINLCFPPTCPPITTIMINLMGGWFLCVPSYLLSILVIAIIEKQITVSRKYLTVLSSFCFMTIVALLFSSSIFAFLDAHPWIATILVGILTLVGGIIIGRRPSQK